MPKLGDTGEDWTRKLSQPVKEDPIYANASQKAQSVRAKHLGADYQSCQPRDFVVYDFKYDEASVRKGMEIQHFRGVQMPLAINKD